MNALYLTSGKKGVNEMEDLILINEDGLNQLVLKIYDYSERINDIFNQLDDLMFQSKNYFDCHIGNDIYIKYLSNVDSIKNVKLNISSYSDELMMVRKNFSNNAEMISSDIKKHSDDIQSYYN